MAFFDGVINLFSSDPLTGGILLGGGFLISHVIHAIRYGFVGYGKPLEKIIKFFKILLFLNV